MRRRALLLSLLLPALAAGAAFAGAGPAGALRAAEREYRAHLLLSRPDLATRFGLRGAESRLAPVTEATIREDGAKLAALAARLAAIDRAGLAAPEAARLDTLRARVALERAPYASGAWHDDPATYLPLGPGAVFDAAFAPRKGPCSRVRHAVGRLRALPEVLRSARINLAASARGTAGDAAPWLAAVDSLRALPARFAACREPGREADLVEADSLAIAAVERFVRFLREERGAAGGGREGSERIR